MRPLPTPCRWKIAKREAHLYWHYGCIGYVVREGEAWALVIEWGTRLQRHRVASVEQGVRYLTRYIQGRNGLPPINRRD